MRKRVASAWLRSPQKHAASSSSSFTSSSSDFLSLVHSEETPPLLRRVVNGPLSRARINSSHVGGNNRSANAASKPLSREEDSFFFFADGFSSRRAASFSTSINDANDCSITLDEERGESTARPRSREDIYLPQNTGGPSSSFSFSSPSHSTRLATEGGNQRTRIEGTCMSGAAPRGVTLPSSSLSLFLSTEAMTIRSFITAGSATAVRESTQRLLQLFLSLQYRVHRCLPPELENTSVDYRELLGLPLSYSIGRGGVEGAVSANREEEGRSTFATTHANASTRHHMKTNACDTLFWNRDDDGDTMREAMCSDSNRLHEYVVAKVVGGNNTGTCTGIPVVDDGRRLSIGTVSPPRVVVSVWEAIFIACEMHHARHGQYLEAVMLAASETLSLSNAPTTVTATAAEVAVRGGGGFGNENNNTSIMDDRYDDHDDDRTIAEQTSSALFPSSSSADSQSRLVSSPTSNGYGKTNENENTKQTNNNKSKPLSHLRVPYLHSVAIKLFRCLRYYRSRQSHTASTMATSSASTATSCSSTATITIDDDAFYGTCACRVLSILASLSSPSASATTTATTTVSSSSSSSLVAWSFLIYDVLQETPRVISALERNEEQAGNSRDLLSSSLHNKNSRAAVLEGGVLVTTSSPQQVEDTTGKTSSSSREPLPDSVVAAPIPTFSFARKCDENIAKKARGKAEVGGKESSGGALLPPLTPSQALVVFMARLIDDTVDEFLLLAHKEGEGKHEIHRRREAQTHHGNNHYYDFILCSVSSSYSHSDALLNTKEQRGVEGKGSPPLLHGADKNNNKKKILKAPETATTLAPRSSVVDVRYERDTHSTCKSSSGSSGAEMDANAADALFGGHIGYAKQLNGGRFVVEEQKTAGIRGGGGGFLPSILNTVMLSQQAKMSSPFGGSNPSKGSAARGNKTSAPLRWRESDRRLRQRSPILIETLVGTVASMCLSERTLTVLLTSPTAAAAAAANCSSARVGVAATSVDENSGGAYFSTPFSSSVAMATVSGPQAALILLEEVLLNLRFSSSASSASQKGMRSVTAATERASLLLPPTTEQKRRPFFSSLFASSSSSTVGDSSDSPAGLATYTTSTGNKTTSLAILHAAAQAAAEREKAEALKGGLMVPADSYDGTCAPQMALRFAAANQQHLPPNTCALPPAVLTLLNTYFAPVASRLLLIDHTRNDSGGCGGTFRGSTTSSSSSSTDYSSDYELLTRLVFLLYRAFGSIAAHSNSVADSASAMLLALAMRSLNTNSAATATTSRVTCTGTGTTASVEGATLLALPQTTVTLSAENPAANVRGTESTAAEREGNKAGAHPSRIRANFPFYSSAFSASTLDFSSFKRSLPRCGQSIELYLRIKDGVPLLPTRAILAKESLRAVLSEVRTRSVLERALAQSLREQHNEELASAHEAGLGTSKTRRTTTKIMRVDDDLRLASLRRSFATHSEDVSKIIQLILDDFSSFSSSSSSSSFASLSTPLTLLVRPSNAVILDLLAMATAILEELAITTQSIDEAESKAAVEDVDAVAVGTTCSVSDVNNNDNESGRLYAEARRRLPAMLSGVISSSYASSYPSSPLPFSTSFPFSSSSLSLSSSSAIEEVQLWLLHSFSSSLLAFTLSSSAAASAVCGSSAVSKKKDTVVDDDDAQSEEQGGTARSFFSSVFFPNTTRRKSHRMEKRTGGSGGIHHRHAHAHNGDGAHLYFKSEEEEDLKRLYVLYCSSAVLFSRYLSLSAATSAPSAASFAVDVNERHHQEENKEELAAVENVLDAVTQELIAAATMIPYRVTATTKYGQTDVSSGAKCTSTITGNQKVNPFSLRSSFASFACAVRWLVPKWRESVSPPIPLFPHDTIANNNNRMKKGNESSPRSPLFLEFSEACASPHAIFGGHDVGSGKSSSSRSTSPLMGGRKSIFSFSEVPPVDDQNSLITVSPAQHLLMQMTEAVLAFTHIQTTTRAARKGKASDAEDRQQQQEQWRRGGERVRGFPPCLYPFWPLQDFTVPLLQLIDGTLAAFSFAGHPSDAHAVDAVNTARNGNVSLLAEGAASSSSSNRYASFSSFLPSIALNILTNSSVRTAPPPPLRLLRDRSNRSLVEQQHSRGKEEEEEIPPLHAFHLLQQRVCRQLAEKVLLLSPTLSSSCSSFRTTGAFSWSTLESVALSCCYPAQMAATAKSISMTHTRIATRRVLTVLVELPTVERFLLSFAPHHGDGFLCSNKRAPLLDTRENGMEIADEMMRRNTAHTLLACTSRSRNQMAIEMIKKELAGGRGGGGEWKKGGPLHASPSKATGGGQHLKNTKEHQHQYGGDTGTVKDSNKNASISAIVNALLDEMNQVAFNCCEHISTSASTALTNTTCSSGSDELRAEDSVERGGTATTTAETEVDETEVHFHFTFPAALALPAEVREALFQQQERQEQGRDGHMLTRPLRTTILPSVDFSNESDTRRSTHTKTERAERRVPYPSPSSHRRAPAAVSVFASVIQPEVPYVRNGRAYGTALAQHKQEQQNNKESVGDNVNDNNNDNNKMEKNSITEDIITEDRQIAAETAGGGGGDGTIQPRDTMSSTAPLKEDREIIILTTTGGLSSSSSSSASFSKAPQTMMGTEMGRMRSGEMKERNNIGGSTSNRTPSPMLDAIERLVVQHRRAGTTTAMIGSDEESGTEEEHSAKSQGRTLFLWSSSVVPKSDKKKEAKPSSREYGGTSTRNSSGQSMEVAKEGRGGGGRFSSAVAPIIITRKDAQSQQQQEETAEAVAAPLSSKRRAKEALRSLIVIPIMGSASAFASQGPCRNHFAPSASGQTTSAPTTTTAAQAAVGSGADNTANTTTATCTDTRTRGSTPLAVSSSSSSVFKTSGFTSRKRHPSASTSPLRKGLE